MEMLFPEMQQVIFPPYKMPYIGSLLRSVDAAILRFSDSVVSAEITRQRWTNIYRANFNSKVIIYTQILILYSC
jgi:hypothetical protein